MSIRATRGNVNDLVRVENVLVSVFDKEGLPDFVRSLAKINPNVRFLSTGGTGKVIGESLERGYGILTEIGEFTQVPEMEGGLVKTLTHSIYAGILGESGNPSHDTYLGRIGAIPIHMVVGGFYDVKKAIEDGADIETVRGHIDIGGPCMLRAAAKNFLQCASVSSPDQYNTIIREMEEQDGALALSRRAELARTTFSRTANYDRAIAEHLIKLQAHDPNAFERAYLGKDD